MTRLFQPKTYTHFRAQPRIGIVVWRTGVLLLLLGLIGTVVLSPTVYGAPRAQQIPNGCIELITNGGFETSGPEWELMGGARPPVRATDITLNESSHSMQLGITDLSNIESESFAKQTVSLPSGVSRITLTFHYYTRWSGTNDPGDLQYAEIFNNLTNAFLDRALQEQSNSRTWNFKQHDLTPYSGQQISLYFVVANDGGENSVAMNIDNVSILACDPISPPTSTPTNTSTPTLTPTPDPTNPTPTNTPTNTPVTPGPTATPVPVVTVSGCQNYLVNGSFEAGTDDFYNHHSWIRGQDPVQAQLVTDNPNSGLYAALLGNPPGNGHDNIQTYSSIRQLVQLPPYLTSLELRWRHRSESQESATQNPSRTDDRMDVIFLQPDLVPIEVVDRQRSKSTAYEQEKIPLKTAMYSGKRFFVYFNVYNDGFGGRTWSKIDDIELIGCREEAKPAQPAATNTPSSTPTNTNTPEPGDTNTPPATNTPITPSPDPPAGLPAPLDNVAEKQNTPEPALRSTEAEPQPEYATTPIRPAEGLQEPTTLATFETVNNRGLLDRLGLTGTDPDPQPTGSFQWLQTAVTCLLALAVLALVLYLARALIMRRTNG